MRARALERGGRLVVASHNEGKVREIRELLAPWGIDTVSAGELGLDEPEETEASFAGNARLKALAAARGAKLPALADDSGLAVDALGGDPGIHSARWAGPAKDFAVAMARVEDALETAGATTPETRRAHFVCALCLAWPDGHSESFEGKVFGTLVWPPRGNHGFGYDPMFLPAGRDRTFGEMAPAAKHAMSHRAAAFAAMVEACLERRCA
jgi:XTP/dITP diphosphohydrolase